MLRFKRLISLILTLAIVVTILPSNGFANVQTVNEDFEFQEGPYNNTGISGVITAYKGSSRVVNIPETINGQEVKGIGVGAFKGKKLTKVTLPSTLEYIGDEAFQDNLIENIYIPARVTKIGEGAFRKMYSELWDFKSIVVTGMEGIKDLEDSTFAELSSLSLDIPSLTEINVEAFRPRVAQSFDSYTLLYTGNNNKNKLESLEHNYLVDPAIVRARAIDSKTKALLNVEDHLGAISSGKWSISSSIDSFYTMGNTSAETSQAFKKEGYARTLEKKTVKLDDKVNEIDFDFEAIEIIAPFGVTAKDKKIEGKTYPLSKISLYKQKGFFEKDLVETKDVASDGSFIFENKDFKDGETYILKTFVDNDTHKGESYEHLVVVGTSKPGIKEVPMPNTIKTKEGEIFRLPFEIPAFLTDGSQVKVDVYFDTSGVDTSKAGIYWFIGSVTYKEKGNTLYSGNVPLKLIVEKKSTNVDTNKTDLRAKIDEAKENISNVKISQNGSDFYPNIFWVTQKVYDDYNNKIVEAQKILKDKTVDQDTVDKATKTLQAATALFIQERKKGSKIAPIEVINGKLEVHGKFDDFNITNKEATISKIDLKVVNKETRKEFGISDIREEDGLSVLVFDKLDKGSYTIKTERYIPVIAGIRAKNIVRDFVIAKKDQVVLKDFGLVRGVKVSYHVGEHGTTTDDIYSYYVPKEHLDDLYQPNIKAKEGWKFDGWSEDGKNVIIMHRGVDEDLDLYAVYSPADPSAIDINTPIDAKGHWRLGDFTYEKDIDPVNEGKNFYMVTGFSDTGKQKATKWFEPTLPHITPDGNKVVAIGQNAFDREKYDERIEINEIIIPEGINSIYSHAFYGMRSLTKVTFPNSLKVIGDNAFLSCGLVEIDLPTTLEKINEGAFAENFLKTLVIPASVKVISPDSFSLNQISELVLQEGLQTIGRRAFWENKLKQVVIPSSLSKIESEAFGQNTGLSNYGARVGLFTKDRKNPNNLATQRQDYILNPEITGGEGLETDRIQLHSLIEKAVRISHDHFVAESPEKAPKGEKYFSPEFKKEIEHAIYAGYYAYYDDSNISQPLALQNISGKKSGFTINEAKGLLDQVIERAEIESKPGSGRRIPTIKTVTMLGLTGEGIEYKDDVTEKQEYVYIDLKNPNSKAYRWTEALDASPHLAFLSYYLPFEGDFKLEAPMGKVFTKKILSTGEELEDDTNISMPHEGEFEFSAENGIVFIFDLMDKGELESGRLYETRMKGNGPKYTPQVKPKDGYIFKGWTLNGKDLVDMDTLKSHGNLIFKALYEKASPEEVSKEELANLIKKVESYLKTIKESNDGLDISADSKWAKSTDINTIKTGIGKARQVLENSVNKKDIDEAKVSLSNMFKEFKNKVQDGKKEALIGRDRLIELINRAEELKDETAISTNGLNIEEKYKYWIREEDYNKLEKVLVDANWIAEDELAEEGKISEEISKLEGAVSDFIKARNPIASKVDTTELKKKLEEAKKLDLTNKTEDSLSILKDAMKKAEDILNKNNPSQEEVLEATSRLSRAIEGLKNKSEQEDPTPSPIGPNPRPDNPTINPLPKPNKSEEQADNKLERLAGENRYETAIEVSKRHFKKADTVIIARSDVYPDALSASMLSKVKKAPILLTPSDKLLEVVNKEIHRLGAKNVIIVGGDTAISKDVEKTLEEYKIERLAGKDRYETSAKIARKLAEENDIRGRAIIASGQVWADALAAGSFSSIEKYPILLVEKDSVPKVINKTIKDLGIKEVYIVGGSARISNDVKSQLPSIIKEFAGKDRYETASLLADYAFADSKKAYLASGESFADSLIIGGVAGLDNSPILLTSRNTMSEKTSTYLDKSKIEEIEIIGGSARISYSIENSLK